MTWDSFWGGVGDFVYAWRVPLTILLILVVTIVGRLILLSLVRRLVDQVVSGVKKKQNVSDTQALQASPASPLAAVRIVQRTRTIGTVLTNVINVTVVIIAIVWIVTTIDPNILGSLALLTAALGAGLGFGAQNIVKDVLNGLFMVFEDQLGVGDVVDLGPATGVVEKVGIRVTTVRDVNGTLWFVRNGEILRVGNMSQGWSRVIIDLAVPYDSDLDAVQDRMLQVAVDMSESTKWRSRILERPEIWGLESISAEALVVRLVVKTRSSAKDDVARELRARLKGALDEMDITLPSLNTVVLSGFEEATSVRGARPPKTKPVPVTGDSPSPSPAPRGRRPSRPAKGGGDTGGDAT
jgi:moderate conductance mechanosensitive channel